MKFWIILQILLHPSQQPWHQKVIKRSIHQNFSMDFFIHNIKYLFKFRFKRAEKSASYLSEEQNTSEGSDWFYFDLI